MAIMESIESVYLESDNSTTVVTLDSIPTSYEHLWLTISAADDRGYYVDPIDIIDKKISAFEVFDHTLPTYASNVWTYPTDLYRVSSVRHNEKTCSRISLKEFGLIKSQPLLRPTANRPVYIETPTGFKIYIDATGVTAEVTSGSISKIDYIKTPTDVSWGYNVILGKAMYNSNTSTNFDMHESEEVNLVNRILVLAGITIKDIGLFRSAVNEEIKDIQQEKQ